MENILRKIVASDNLYGRFLNTLSLMEYIGARKIIKSQSDKQLNKKLLDHMAEEIRHAQRLKRAALRAAPNVCKDYSPAALLCGDAAYRYFQTVDHAAQTECNEHNPWHCYLYTTFLIEVRVLLFYAAFEKILLAFEKPSVFRGILAEEKNHLEEVSAHLSALPDFEKNMVRLKNIEAEAFEKFLMALNAAVA
jgi:hypothetical protein